MKMICPSRATEPSSLPRSYQNRRHRGQIGEAANAVQARRHSSMIVLALVMSIAQSNRVDLRGGDLIKGAAGVINDILQNGSLPRP